MSHSIQCECSDSGCPACKGSCEKTMAITLYRIDMEDLTGTNFCNACANDCFESGVFTSSKKSDNDEEE